LRRWQRASLGIAGAFQTGARLLVKGLSQASREIRSIAIGEGVSPGNDERLRFFDDSVALKWRYPEEQYEQLAFEGKKGEYVIVKSGAPDRYLRVCQWRLGSDQPTGQLVARLIETAQKQMALGIRWAVYGDDEAARNLSRRIRKFGFLCARRARTLLIFSKEPELLSADRWDIADGLFSFDP